MNRLLNLMLVSAMAFTLFTGCATRSDFTAISGKNVNIANIKLDPAMAKGQTSGEDCQHIVIIIPTGGAPTLDEALDKALEAKQANLMLDAVVRHNWFYIPYIYGQECWKVEGVAYDTFQ